MWLGNIGQDELFCLMFKTVSLDFSGFQGCQNVKTVDNTITPPELIEHCPPSFRHIHRHKAASRHRQLMAEAVSKRKTAIEDLKKPKLTRCL
jgi:hypothetical protein